MPNELIIRTTSFFIIFIVMALWEIIKPRRVLTTPKAARWFNNLGIILLDNLIVRFAAPILPASVALVAQERGWGLLNVLALPGAVELILGVALLDCVIYWQHVAFHRVPILWRLHRMHHTDLDLDVTSGLRFHPIEIIISLGIKIGAVVLLGTSAVAVVVFEVLLNATAMFNHANAYVPLSIDRVLRLLVVTPDMHRVHHSVIPRETDSNFGFNLPWWDRIFRTYRAQPVKGHDGMTIGLREYRAASELTLPRLLILPFT